jgi:hypothetical protein
LEYFAKIGVVFRMLDKVSFNIAHVLNVLVRLAHAVQNDIHRIPSHLCHVGVVLPPLDLVVRSGRGRTADGIKLRAFLDLCGRTEVRIGNELAPGGSVCLGNKPGTELLRRPAIQATDYRGCRLTL